ncbi:hypothetical protein RIR_jg8418.t1 [Rhizophagus irregularis DAOM 181602=DAOM 197198]|uniref:Uncharacterized protein n=1 Tax=Rhizophagus irregularis (strain DAOM 181602 / DAOM 197198 / MUCL 43194) TaxID=747089 RepID=U9SW34_RHIID|nr:hypothetical protein RIR_jg8418.t1 [Rhizophagus irregularis DAOM 181602=DAOM 197198]
MRKKPCQSIPDKSVRHISFAYNRNEVTSTSIFFPNKCEKRAENFVISRSTRVNCLCVLQGRSSCEEQDIKHVGRCMWKISQLSHKKPSHKKITKDRKARCLPPPL